MRLIRNIVLTLATVTVVLVCWVLIPSGLWSQRDDRIVISKRQMTTLPPETQLPYTAKDILQRDPETDIKMWPSRSAKRAPRYEKLPVTARHQPLQAPRQYSFSGNTSASHVLSMKHNCSIISGNICDCSSRGWTTIPQDLPITCKTLNMYNNSLREITNASFAKTPSLEYLTLEKNQISTLHLGAFMGLPLLSHLNLGDNSLPMLEGVFPRGIFKPLESLISLDISKNNKHPENESLEYPDLTLAELPLLEELFIDGLYDKVLGDGFKELKFLRNLSLAGYCNLHSITEETFRNVAGLDSLNISGCHIDGSCLDAGAFAMFHNLKTLDVSWNDMIGLNKMLLVMKKWANNSLQNLNISYIRRGYSSLGRRIKKEDVASLPKTLRVLDARGNGIEIVDDDVFENLPQHLNVLNVGVNRFLLACYLKYLPLMKHLKMLLVNGGYAVFNLPKNYPPSDNDTDIDRSYLFSSRFTDNCDTFGNESLIFYLPPEMTFLSMDDARLSYNIPEIYVDPNNSLEQLYLDRNRFPHLIGPIHGLARLKKLSFRGCNVQWISHNFFQNLTSLTYLDLSCNVLGLAMSDPTLPGVFKDLTSLQFFNLSFNAYHSVSPSFFDGLGEVKQLYLQNNRFWTFNAFISHMNNLRVLNLEQSSLSRLTKNITDQIDKLIRKFPGEVMIDLSDSSIVCKCENLDFLEWMSKSEAFTKSLHSKKYGCVSQNVFRTVKDGYVQTVKDLKRKCITNYTLFLLTLTGTLILASGVLGLILYRFRWNIRYLYYAAYLSLKKGQDNRGRQDEFEYDVFISYSSDDEHFIVHSVCPELERRGVTLLVHGRDFRAGEYIASNILTAVQQSRKTLVVLTRALLRSTWCKYELQMANMETANTGRPVLVFLLKESIPNRELGTQLLYHIRSNTYIPYPQPGGDEETDQNLMTAFWDKLADDLKA